MHRLIFIFFLVLSNTNIVAFSQDQDKTVTLTVSGQGKSSEEAKQIALRSAIEQAFGTFISSKTEILNDNLVKDEIISVSNGNIQKIEVLSDIQVADSVYVTTLNATVSVTKLTSFVESKGIAFEFKGNLFAFNIYQQILNEKNELVALENMVLIIKGIAQRAFTYEIEVKDPVSVKGSNDFWNIPVTTKIKTNKNFTLIPTIIYSTLNGLGLTLDQADSYTKLEKKYYPVSFAVDKNHYGQILLRNEKSINLLIELIYSFSADIMHFNINNGIDILDPKFIRSKQNNPSVKFSEILRLKGTNPSEFNNEIKEFYDRDKNQVQIEDEHFRIILCNRYKYSGASIFGMDLDPYNKPNPIFDYKSLTLNKNIFNINYNKQASSDVNNSSGEFGNEFRGNFKFAYKCRLKKGLFISFIGIKEGDIIVIHKFNDLKNLEDLKKISEYKVSTLLN